MNGPPARKLSLTTIASSSSISTSGKSLGPSGLFHTQKSGSLSLGRFDDFDIEAQGSGSQEHSLFGAEGILSEETQSRIWMPEDLDSDFYKLKNIVLPTTSSFQSSRNNPTYTLSKAELDFLMEEQEHLSALKANSRLKSNTLHTDTPSQNKTSADKFNPSLHSPEDKKPQKPSIHDHPDPHLAENLAEISVVVSEIPTTKTDTQKTPHETDERNDSHPISAQKKPDGARTLKRRNRETEELLKAAVEKLQRHKQRLEQGQKRRSEPGSRKCIRNWILLPRFVPEGDDANFGQDLWIAVAGFLVDRSGHTTNVDTFWASSLIYKRVSDRLLETSNGSSYMLLGDIDSKEMKRYGFPDWVSETFRKGFPTNWRVHVQNMCKPGSPVHTRAVQHSQKREKIQAKEKEKRVGETNHRETALPEEQIPQSHMDNATAERQPISDTRQDMHSSDETDPKQCESSTGDSHRNVVENDVRSQSPTRAIPSILAQEADKKQPSNPIVPVLVDKDVPVDVQESIAPAADFPQQPLGTNPREHAADLDANCEVINVHASQHDDLGARGKGGDMSDADEVLHTPPRQRHQIIESENEDDANPDVPKVQNDECVDEDEVIRTPQKRRVRFIQSDNEEDEKKDVIETSSSTNATVPMDIDEPGDRPVDLGQIPANSKRGRIRKAGSSKRRQSAPAAVSAPEDTLGSPRSIVSTQQVMTPLRGNMRPLPAPKRTRSGRMVMKPVDYWVSSQRKVAVPVYDKSGNIKEHIPVILTGADRIQVVKKESQ